MDGKKNTYSIQDKRLRGHYLMPGAWHRTFLEMGLAVCQGVQAEINHLRPAGVPSPNFHCICRPSDTTIYEAASLRPESPVIQTPGSGLILPINKSLVFKNKEHYPFHSQCHRHVRLSIPLPSQPASPKGESKQQSVRSTQHAIP